MKINGLHKSGKLGEATDSAKDKMSVLFNSRAYKVAGVVKEGAFCAAFVLAAATGVVAPLSAAMITTAHGFALGRNLKRLLTPAPVSVSRYRVSANFSM